MDRARNVLRVNKAEEQEAFRSAISEMLRIIQHDHRVTLREIAESIDCTVATISNAANKNNDLNPIYLKRIGEAFGPAALDPYVALAGGRVVPREAPDGADVLPVINLAGYRIAAARTPSSPGGTSETLKEQLGYLPDLRSLQRELGALICRIEQRRDAA